MPSVTLIIAFRLEWKSRELSCRGCCKVQRTLTGIGRAEPLHAKTCALQERLITQQIRNNLKSSTLGNDQFHSQLSSGKIVVLSNLIRLSAVVVDVQGINPNAVHETCPKTRSAPRSFSCSSPRKQSYRNRMQFVISPGSSIKVEPSQLLLRILYVLLCLHSHVENGAIPR